MFSFAPIWAHFFIDKGGNMIKKYLILAICGLIFGAFIYGRGIGVEKCKLEMAVKNNEFLQQQTKQRKKINAEVYHTNMRDVRRVLRAKYTIAE